MHVGTHPTSTHRRGERGGNAPASIFCWRNASDGQSVVRSQRGVGLHRTLSGGVGDRPETSQFPTTRLDS
jgi:hypothetical protein